MPGNKSLDAKYAAHVQRVLLDVIAKDFTDAGGKTVSERMMAKRLHISQPQINAIRNWSPERGKAPNIGVGALLALSDYTHMTVDAVLGRAFPLAVQQRQEQLDLIVAKAEEITHLLEAESTFAFGPKSKIGKLRDQIQKLARSARQQKQLDERERLVNEPVSPTPRKTGS